ncbi:DUF503 domain-containing protein [Kineococcus esterisolvens]|uniref:DUF503 domain-containing protein n=1 Tax=unclassified Kineococcus TaxID=2621656 RepID=UPI003D7C4411
MFTGTLTFDLLLGDVHSLKGKRSVVRPLVAELRRSFDVAAAETGSLDLHRRAEVAVAVVAPDAARCTDVLDRCERLVSAHPEFQILSTRRQFLSSDD